MDEIEIYFELDTSFSLFGMYFYKVVGIGLIEAQELEQYKFWFLFVEYQLFLLNPSNYTSYLLAQNNGNLALPFFGSNEPIVCPG